MPFAMPVHISLVVVTALKSSFITPKHALFLSHEPSPYFLRVAPSVSNLFPFTKQVIYNDARKHCHHHWPRIGREASRQRKSIFRRNIHLNLDWENETGKELWKNVIQRISLELIFLLAVGDCRTSHVCQTGPRYQLVYSFSHLDDLVSLTSFLAPRMLHVESPVLILVLCCLFELYN